MFLGSIAASKAGNRGKGMKLLLGKQKHFQGPTVDLCLYFIGNPNCRRIWTRFSCLFGQLSKGEKDRK